MYEKQCRRCGCSMDPGEGLNGICDDCITGETERRQREDQMERMVRATREFDTFFLRSNHANPVFKPILGLFFCQIFHFYTCAFVRFVV